MSIEQKTTTAEALLGVLSLRPMSGYQIRRQIEESIGNFWQESFGQIYPTLKKLRAAGLVEMERDSGQRERGGRGRGESRVYALTEAGRRRLTEWIGTSSVPQVPRNEVLLKIFFGALVPVETVRSQIEECRERHREALRKYAVIETALRAARGRDPRLPFWLMTLEYGKAESGAMVAWADGALSVCAGLAKEEAPQCAAEGERFGAEIEVALP